MDSASRFCLRFSGITVRFVLPKQIRLPSYFAPFLCEDTTAPDEEYTVTLLTSPLRPDGDPVVNVSETRIYQTKKGWLHIHPVQGDEIGCQVACLFCPDGHHTIYYPASRWEEYSEVWSCAHLICGERLLLRHDAFLLHSSVVHYQGKAVLFSGPSGVGKSTQATLWKTHLGADIINGDRTVIRKTANGFTGGGSMWSGTSGIYRSETAQIAGIILVEHGKEETLERLGFEAFKPLLTQTIVNSWDEEFIQKVTGLLAEVMDTVPIYRLRCRPIPEAAALVRDTLFGKEPQL